MTAADQRRHKLITWLRERPEHDGLSASEIVDVAGIYEGHGRYDRCFDDLVVLAGRGVVERWTARPARWSLKEWVRS